MIDDKRDDARRDRIDCDDVYGSLYNVIIINTREEGEGSEKDRRTKISEDRVPSADRDPIIRARYYIREARTSVSGREKREREARLLWDKSDLARAIARAFLRVFARTANTYARLPAALLWKKSIYMFPQRVDLVVELRAAMINEGAPREREDHTGAIKRDTRFDLKLIRASRERQKERQTKKREGEREKVVAREAQRLSLEAHGTPSYNCTGAIAESSAPPRPATRKRDEQVRKVIRTDP